MLMLLDEASMAGSMASTILHCYYDTTPLLVVSTLPEVLFEG